MKWTYYKPKFDYEIIFNDFDWAWAGHKFFAYDFIRNFKPRKIVELGVHKGTSFFSFCQAVKDEFLDSELNAIDTWKGDHQSGFYEEEVFDLVSDIKNECYRDLKINLMRKFFDEALHDFQDESIDLLHIDGLHTYEAVKHDFETWLPKVKKDGVVFFHDICEKKDDFGVYKLWEELKEKYSTLEFHHSHGLGVCFLNSKTIEDLPVFEEIWRNYYECFNEKVVLLNEKEIVAKRKDEEITELNEVVSKKDEEVAELNEVVSKKEEEMAELNEVVKKKDEEMAELNEVVKRKDEEITELNEVVKRKENEISVFEFKIHSKNSEILALRKSYSFRIGRIFVVPVALIVNFFKVLKKKLMIGLNDVALAFRLLKREGIKEFFRRFFLYISGKDQVKNSLQAGSYNEFLKKHEVKTEDISKIKKECLQFKYKPKISVIVPVYNVDPKWLKKCINSVLNQYYDNFEICLYDDCSTNLKTRKYLERIKRETNDKVKILFGKENKHISLASNEAIKMATGEFIALLDNDDEITSDALYEVVKALNADRMIDFIYSDEDKMEMDGSLSVPVFKPDFSIDYFLSTNYLCHFSVIRKSLGDSVGWFRKGFEGSQDYDLFIRILEKTGRIYHIPKILYHWRKIPGSTACVYSAKGYAHEASLKALNEYLDRNKIEASVEEGFWPGSFRVKRKIKGNPLVSIIIPFKDRADLLKKCLEGIFNKNDYKHFEIILVSNNSVEKETFSLIEEILNQHKNVKFYEYNKPFNYSEINNFAVDKAEGNYVLFLNNDVEVISTEWLSSMVEHIQRPEVGAVGSRLLYPDGRIQHAGVIIGLGGLAAHSHRLISGDNYGYCGRINITQNLSACTAACLLVKKDLFLNVGGFDEKNLKVAFNDVDLCLKIREEGYLIVYTPYSLLYHHESVSRGVDVDPIGAARFNGECDFMKKKWKDVLTKGDPYYNPNLTLDREDFSYKWL